MTAAAEVAYRAEVVRFDDSVYGRGLAEAGVALTVTSLEWHLPRVLVEDSEWGIAGSRPRFVTRLHSAAALCERAGVLPSFESFARALYPAFR